MITVGLLATLLTGIALMGILAPVARTRRRRHVRRASAPGEDERLRLLRTLRDLERDRERGALAQPEYDRWRRETVAAAAELIRRTSGGERGAELAAALRPRSPNRARPAGPRQSVLISLLVAAAAVAGAVPLLAGAVGPRAPGGFVTGAQPPAAPPVAATASPSTATLPAAAPLEQQVAAHPDDLGARLELAQTYLEAGQVKPASQQYVEVLKRDPGNPEAATRLALLLYEAGDTKDALAGVDRVLSTHPDYPEALFLKGVILLNALDRPRDAVEPLQRYLQVAPTGGYRDDAQQLLNQARAAGG